MLWYCRFKWHPQTTAEAYQSGVAIQSMAFSQVNASADVFAMQ